MSTAHRPTWSPAQGKETVGKSRQYAARDIAGHTRLKFRQPGQGTKDEIRRRDLRLELEKAEKRAKVGGSATAEETTTEKVEQDDEGVQAAKRRKVLIEAAELDKDDSDDDKAVENVNGEGNGQVSEEDSDSDSDEDEEAALMRELQKIRRERAEEQARLEREKVENETVDREAAIATANPLLNLQAAIHPSARVSGSEGFAVKRRWDDDVIFKNQARGADEKAKQNVFVNDLLRTEFHRKFLKRYIA